MVGLVPAPSGKGCRAIGVLRGVARSAILTAVRALQPKAPDWGAYDGVQQLCSVLISYVACQAGPRLPDMQLKY